MSSECAHEITAVAGSLDRRWLYECGRCGQWLHPHTLPLDALRSATRLVVAVENDAARSRDTIERSP